jgi:hypothetical protein
MLKLVPSRPMFLSVAVLADRALPLDAEFGRLVGIHLGDQAFDKHLRAALVELVDHGAQLAVLRLGRGDDERVGGRVGLDLPAGGRLAEAATGDAAALAPAAASVGWVMGAPTPPPPGGATASVGRQAARRSRPAWPRRRSSGTPHRCCPTAVCDGGLVQPLDQRTHQVQPRRVGRAHDQRIAARLGDHRGAKRGVGLALQAPVRRAAGSPIQSGAPPAAPGRMPWRA